MKTLNSVVARFLSVPRILSLRLDHIKGAGHHSHRTKDGPQKTFTLQSVSSRTERIQPSFGRGNRIYGP